MSTVIWVTMAVGIAAVLQAQFMGTMTDRMGTMESVFITYGIGGVLATIAIVMARGGNVGELRALPWYVTLAGVAGLVIVAGMGISVARVGLVATTTLVIAFQFMASSIVDHFGLLQAVQRPVTLSRIAGMATVLLGTWLVVR